MPGVGHRHEMDEEEYRDLYHSVNRLRCVFEKAILTRMFACENLVKTNIAGKGGPLFTSPYLLGSLDLTSDSQLLVLAGAQVEGQEAGGREIDIE